MTEPKAFLTMVALTRTGIRRTRTTRWAVSDMGSVPDPKICNKAKQKLTESHKKDK